MAFIYVTLIFLTDCNTNIYAKLTKTKETVADQLKYL